MPQIPDLPHSEAHSAIDWGDPAELTLRLKYGPDVLRVIQRRFQLKGGEDRPDHHGTPSARRTPDRAAMLENLQRLKTATAGQPTSTTLYDFTEDEM